MSNPIPPRLLHKSSSDDVLITDAALPLPAWLDAAVLSQRSLPVPALDALYLLADQAGVHFDQGRATDGADSLRRAGKLNDAQRWLALRAVPYQVACAVAQNAGMDPATLKDMAAQLAASVNLPRRSSSFLFVNDASHYFFYRKTHDHVPGIMLVEAQRQAIYYHLYSRSAWVRGEVTVSLNNLQAHFFDYANLMYPIEIIVDDLAAVPVEKPRKVCFRVSFYQRARLIAVIDTDATVIAIDQFKKIRNTFMHGGDWFTPIDDLLSCKVSRLSPDAGERIGPSVRLAAVSKHGLRLESSDPAQLFAEMQVEIANSDGNTFCANAILETVRKCESTWRFKDAASEDLLMLGMIIASGCVSAAPVHAG